MRHHFAIPAMALLCAMLSACTHTLTVTYNCDPEGAAIYQDDGTKLGNCPVTVSYPVTKANQQQGYLLLKGVSAHWVSGASASVQNIRADLRIGYSQQMSLLRPANAPGQDTDAAYAIQLQRNAISAQQAQAAQEQAQWSAAMAGVAAAAQARANSDAAAAAAIQANPIPRPVQTNCQWQGGNLPGFPRQWVCTTY